MSDSILDNILQNLVPGLGAILSITKYASSLQKVNMVRFRILLSYPFRTISQCRKIDTIIIFHFYHLIIHLGQEKRIS